MAVADEKSAHRPIIAIVAIFSAMGVIGPAAADMPSYQVTPQLTQAKPMAGTPVGIVRQATPTS
jgi:hypothetical protein